MVESVVPVVAIVISTVEALVTCRIENYCLAFGVSLQTLKLWIWLLLFLKFKKSLKLLLKFSDPFLFDKISFPLMKKMKTRLIKT